MRVIKILNRLIYPIFLSCYSFGSHKAILIYWDEWDEEVFFSEEQLFILSLHMIKKQ